MIMSVALWALLGVVRPVDLDAVVIERARSMGRRLVVASFVNGAPPWTLAGRTVIGPANRDDGAERIAILRGNRLDIDTGDLITFVGVIRVIDHPPAFVGAALVPAWTEVRVEE
jgi:hypothetical protein